MSTKLARRLLSLGVLAGYGAPGAFACTACFGNPESSQTQGMNAAILTLLGVTCGVMLIAAGVALHIVWNNRGAAAHGAEASMFKEGGSSSW